MCRSLCRVFFSEFLAEEFIIYSSMKSEVAENAVKHDSSSNVSSRKERKDDIRFNALNPRICPRKQKPS